MEGPPTLLKLLPYESPQLRVPSKDVTFPLDVSTVKLVADMKFSILPEQLAAAQAPWPSAAGMAAIQWNHCLRVFLISSGAGEFVARFNASYEKIGTETVDAEEGCFSVPKARGIVRRWRKIKATWMDEMGANHEAELSDWPARVWQHETDHTNGVLYDEGPKCLKKLSL